MNRSMLLRNIVALVLGLVPGLLSSSWSVNALASCGTHTCSVYTDNTQQKNRCYDLACSLRYTQSGCGSLVTWGCRFIPASCGSSSYYSGDLTCASDKRVSLGPITVRQQAQSNSKRFLQISIAALAAVAAAVSAPMSFVILT